MAEKHLAVHFSGTLQSGSIFNPALFDGPEDVLAYLKNYSPKRIIKLRNNRMVYEFELPVPQVAGYEGIGIRQNIPPDAIIPDSALEVRDERGKCKKSETYTQNS